jgi:L-cystine uptake protein TcyP (sodium:dicarboxylate symporter family)
MKNKKQILTKRMSWILTLVILNSGVYYYADYFKQLGGGFSEGILVGWLFGIVFCLALTTLYLFGEMIYNLIKETIKKEDLR